MAAKPPFERVFSLIERKKLLQRVAKEKTKVLIKTPKNEVFEFRAFGVDASFNLEGQLSGGEVREYDKVTALFYVAQDRYFITTRIKKKDGFHILLNDAQFYKFNRRSAFRVHLPESLEVSYYVSTIRNIEINRKVHVIEFSSGGARIQWVGEKRLANGTQLKGALQWGKGKVLPVEAVVVHNPQPGVYGLRFMNMTTVTMNRLKMLSIEVQQAIHFSI
jgi:hypothetical protein